MDFLQCRKHDFQRAAVLGNQVEMDMMLSVEENESLLRVGVAFQSMEARHRVSEALERNYERCMFLFPLCIIVFSSTSRQI